MKVAVLTGEPSGDLLAYETIEALKAQVPDLALLGIGGERLASLGLKSRFPLSEFSLNGIAEVLPHLPRLLFRVEQITRWLLAEQPDVVLTVDAPDLTLRIAKMLRARGIKASWCIWSPQPCGHGSPSVPQRFRRFWITCCAFFPLSHLILKNTGWRRPLLVIPSSLDPRPFCPKTPTRFFCCPGAE